MISHVQNTLFTQGKTFYVFFFLCMFTKRKTKLSFALLNSRDAIMPTFAKDPIKPIR